MLGHAGHRWTEYFRNNILSFPKIVSDFASWERRSDGLHEAIPSPMTALATLEVEPASGEDHTTPDAGLLEVRFQDDMEKMCV